MSTENIPCDTIIAEKLRMLTKRKYGKLKSVFNIEITEAVRKHCKDLEKELANAETQEQAILETAFDLQKKITREENAKEVSS